MDRERTPRHSYARDHRAGMFKHPVFNYAPVFVICDGTFQNTAEPRGDAFFVNVRPSLFCLPRWMRSDAIRGVPAPGVFLIYVRVSHG